MEVPQYNERNWRDAAACRNEDPTLFFPEGDEKKGDGERAKEICESCDVKLICLESALAHSEKWGIWGGLNFANTALIMSLKRRRARRVS